MMNADTFLSDPDVIDESLFQACFRLAKRMDRDKLEAYYSHAARSKRAKQENQQPLNALIKMALSPSVCRILNVQDPSARFSGITSLQQPHSILEMDAQVQKGFQTFGKDFPTAIWTCCKKRCFAHVTILPENSAVFNAVFKIYKKAEVFHNQIEQTSHLVQTRRLVTSTSSITYAGKTRRDGNVRPETDRQRGQRKFKEYVSQALTYLRGNKHAADGTAPPTQPFCIQSICQILGIQRNTLYKPVGGETCVVDDAGVRQRKFRRIGSRTGFRPITELPNFKCGCEVPCFMGLSDEVLQRLWERFKTIAGELSPEEKEHRYLLNQMFCPLTNTSVRVCNKAISQLYTISEPLVASIRLIVHQMCEDAALEAFPAREHGMKLYRERCHPLNRFPQEIIEQVERHLDMILRPDPAAADGVNVCRVYSPEVNTQEKLRRLLADSIRKDVQEIQISPTSLQRMVDSYLKERGCRISFSQADHNACPMCKTLHCEILYLHCEIKRVSERIFSYQQVPRPMTEEAQSEVEALTSSLMKDLSLKEYRDCEAIQELRTHNERDAQIRVWLKHFTDHLRAEENKSRDLARSTELLEQFGWWQRKNRALVTHQDDMTKVDLPHVVVEASADITRWRFDVNAHVSSVTGDCVVFSHEQGTGPKNSSAILELVLLDHILTCRGENIKVVVSDYASVGKNWLSTVVFPQYLVDQGLAEIVLIVFLENNHGKWLADMLFGQFQIRKRNSVILGVDGLLQEFETINRPPGSSLQGYAVNPLSCVDFAQVFTELGYETKPPKDFGFKNRNIHFAAACTPEAKSQLNPRLQRLLFNALPEDTGTVRLCSEPPNTRPYEWRGLDERWVEVPAARANSTRTITVPECGAGPSDFEVPLAVPIDKGFAANGPGLVSKRTAEHVGFNGLSFRNKMSFPELNNEKTVLTREAWPSGLLRAGEVGFESESLRCAPENWVLRRPVRYYSSHNDIKARYPPKNMLNALFCHGPRSDGISVEGEERISWVPKATYREPPFPFEPARSATEALKRLEHDHADIGESVHVLHVLRSVFRAMSNRDGADVWLQNAATEPSPEARQRYSEMLRILQHRDNIRPKPVLTTLQAFRNDKDIQREVEEEQKKLEQESLRSQSQILKDLLKKESCKALRKDYRFWHRTRRSTNRSCNASLMTKLRSELLQKS